MNYDTALDMAIAYSMLEERELADVYDSEIAINSVGERMEYFVKDLLADSFEKSGEAKQESHKECLSWLGSQNHPPDLMVRDGPAIEVKKSRGKHSKLQLNSSTPRTHLRSDMKRVNEDCRQCEEWDEKDMLYVLGSKVSKQSIGFIWAVYGDCWCDDSNVYNSITDSMEDAIKDSLPADVTLDMSGNEIAKVKDVGDGMGAELRARPMWSIGHPAKKFSQYVDNYEQKLDDGQPMFLVLPSDRYDNASPRKKSMLNSCDDISITEVSDEDSVVIEVE